MVDYIDDILRPQPDDTEATITVLARINSTARVNVRSRKALRIALDDMAFEAAIHRSGQDSFNNPYPLLFRRFNIPKTSPRKDGDESAFYRSFVQLHLVPKAEWFDEDSHPPLIASLARALWTYEELKEICVDALEPLSECILDKSLGGGSIARWNHIIDAWEDQTPFYYDRSANKFTPVPPTIRFPPSKDKAPVGSYEDGLRLGKQQGTDIAAKAGRDGLPLPPSPNPPDHDPISGRPYSTVFREGFDEGARSVMRRTYSSSKGNTLGIRDGGALAWKDVDAQKPLLSDEGIMQRAVADFGDGDTVFLAAYVKAFTSRYREMAHQYLNERRRREDDIRKEEQENQRKAAEAQNKLMEAETRRREQAEKAAADAKIGQATAEARRREAEAKQKKEAEQRREAEAKRLDEEKKRRAADERANAEAEKKRSAEAVLRQVREAAQRDAAEAKRKADEDAKRERDQKHRATVHGEIMAAFSAAGIAQQCVEQVLNLITTGTVPHLRIIY